MENADPLVDFSDKILGRGDPFDDVTFVPAIVEGIALANSGGEATEALKRAFLPYIEDLTMLAKMVKDDPRVALDFINVFESWGTREASLTATVIDLVIAACMVKMSPGEIPPGKSSEIVITSAELRSLVEQYDIERTEEAGTWKIKLTKIPK